ncbi:MAG TPA: hypothetical protein VGN02_06705, partial [Paenibacillus sp.]
MRQIILWQRIVLGSILTGLLLHGISLDHIPAAAKSANVTNISYADPYYEQKKYYEMMRLLEVQSKRETFGNPAVLPQTVLTPKSVDSIQRPLQPNLDKAEKVEQVKKKVKTVKVMATGYTAG